MRIALFGGTFNPVHNGHLLMAEAARQEHDLDQILFIPAGLPPHKKSPQTSARHRLSMLKLACRGNPAFKISDWEIRQERVVYTYETVTHFRAQHPGLRPFFLIGSDSLEGLPHWREAKRLHSLCRFITMDRLEPFASHDIRRRVYRGRSIRYRVPETVAAYIQSHRLYRKPE